MEIDWKNLLWPLTTLAGALSALILFREQIREEIQGLLQKIASIEIDPRARRFKVRFAQQVKHVKVLAKGIEKKVAAEPAPSAADKQGKLATQASRDIVLEAWGALKQIVYDACAASKISLTPATRIPEAVRQLVKAKAIDPDIAYLLHVLYDLGQELADNTSLKPVGDDAGIYREVSTDIVNRFMVNILLPGKREEPKRQHTQIERNSRQVQGDADFSHPRPGRPTALLIGIGGPLQGRRFSIEKEHYQIGRNSDNDLPIAGDDYVSGRHASLRYEKGKLFLADQGSRNGTFLNEKKVTGTSVIHWGDHIRLGKSIFQVSQEPVQ